MTSLNKAYHIIIHIEVSRGAGAYVNATGLRFDSHTKKLNI